jgi:hypothetical protein
LEDLNQNKLFNHQKIETVEKQTELKLPEAGQELLPEHI